MDKLRAMQLFVRIADEGSLTAAARRAQTSLPAVVRALAALEKGLGVRLFNRTTRRVVLTEEGRSYLASCRDVLATIAESERALGVSAETLAGDISITAPVMFGQMYVMPALTAFLTTHLATRANLVLLDRMVNLVDEGIDVGIRIGHLDDSTLIARQLGSVRRLVVASPAYLRKHGRPKHPRELAGSNCVVHTGAPPWRFREGRRQISVHTTGNLRLNQIASIADACAAGLGFGMFMAYQVAPRIASRELAIVLEDFEPAPLPINVVYPQARLLPARVRAFIDWIADSLRDFAV